jgi:uncharacterized protein YjiK
MGFAMTEKVVSENCVLCTFSFAKSQSKITLPAELREASGLSVSRAGLVLVHDDETGRILFIDSTNGRVSQTFELMQNGGPMKRDFEGVASTPLGDFLITSDGFIHEFGEGSQREALDTGLGGQFEIEGLTYYPPNNSLMIGVKTIYDKDDPRGLVVFEWSIEEAALTANILSMSKAKLKAETGKRRFRTSGIVYDEESGHFLLVSAKTSMLMEITQDGRFVTGYKMSKKFHKMPEGLALLAGEDKRFLIIADEGVKDSGSLTIYGQINGE